MPEGVAGTFTQSPASIVFSTLYGRVANYVGAPSDADVTTIAKEGINEAIDRLNSRNWKWRRTLQAITMVAGTQEYAVNSTFRASWAAELLNAAGEVKDTLEFLNWKELEDAYPDRSVAGQPVCYSVANEFDNAKLTLNLTPSAAWVAAFPTLRLRYYARVPKLSGDTDLFAGPSEAESFLVWFGRSTVAAHWAMDKVAFAARRADENWHMLVKADTLRDTSDW